jgi:hypothetical protein
MVALDVVVLDELGDRATKVPLAKRDHLRQALRLDRQDEALRVGVQVGTAGGQLDAGHAGATKAVAELNGEERISIVYQVAHALQDAVDGVGEIARHLLHPSAVRLPTDAGDLDTSRLDVDDEEDVVADQPSEREYLDREEPRWRRDGL